MNNLLHNDITKSYAPIADKSIELELVLKAKQGCGKSRNQLVNAQLASIKQKAINNLKSHGRSMELLGEAISEGVLCFDTAIENFDPNEGVWFGTFVQPYISAYIGRWCKAQDLIRTPENRQRTKDIIADYLKEQGMSKQEISKFIAKKSKRELNAFKNTILEENGSSAKSVVSFDTPINDSTMTLADTLGADDTADENSDMISFLAEVTKNLTESQKQILNLYINTDINDVEYGHKRSWQAVADRYAIMMGKSMSKQAVNLGFQRICEQVAYRKDAFMEMI